MTCHEGTDLQSTRKISSQLSSLSRLRRSGLHLVQSAISSSPRRSSPTQPPKSSPNFSPPSLLPRKVRQPTSPSPQRSALRRVTSDDRLLSSGDRRRTSLNPLQPSRDTSMSGYSVPPNSGPPLSSLGSSHSSELEVPPLLSPTPPPAVERALHDQTIAELLASGGSNDEDARSWSNALSDEGDVLSGRSSSRNRGRRSIAIYNDSLPASAQPQTPVGLPRHGVPPMPLAGIAQGPATGPGTPRTVTTRAEAVTAGAAEAVGTAVALPPRTPTRTGPGTMLRWWDDNGRARMRWEPRQEREEAGGDQENVGDFVREGENAERERQSERSLQGGAMVRTPPRGG